MPTLLKPSLTDLLAETTPVDMNRVATIILGGGRGTRLFPLTQSRSKPAISFGGRYRLIDIPMSNSINSGCFKIFIIAQFLSSSLHQHIFKSYRPGTFSSGFIELLSAEEKPKNTNWYLGPADAVRQNMDYFVETPVDYFLILSGDQLYNINFQSMLRFAQRTNADLVVASTPINDKDAKRMGVLQTDHNHFISDFCEKPQLEADLQRMRLSSDKKSAHGLLPDDPRDYLGSMGIYLFKRRALLEILQEDQREDFGKHLIPTQISKGNTAAFIYDGYWEDIGTIESFYNANMALTKKKPEFELYDELNPIFASPANLPGPKIYNANIQNSIICEGSVVEADTITNSILGPRSVVLEGTVIEDSYIMGNDFYKRPIPTERLPSVLGIGKNTLIRKAIVDKHVHIGDNVKLINQNQLDHYNSDHLFVRDGIIIVTRGAVIPDNFVF